MKTVCLSQAPVYFTYINDVENVIVLLMQCINSLHPRVRKRNFPCNDDNVAFMQQVHSKTTGKRRVLLTVIGRQLINCAFTCGRRCARLIIRCGRRYLERTCVECGNGGSLAETMQQRRRAVIKRLPLSSGS